jgi:hypothetical protein
MKGKRAKKLRERRKLNIIVQLLLCERRKTDQKEKWLGEEKELSNLQP